jgi:alkyl sulfatase BDS1-like metallo-beta-lactamase superfamily hydrolase
VVALQTTFCGSGSGADVYELALGDQVFSVAVHDGELEITRGAARAPAVRIATDTRTLAAVLWHGRSLAEAVAGGALTVDGDAAAAERFVAMFAAPVPVAELAK